jgi:hypothetical protein
VPTLDVDAGRVAWSSFDRGASGDAVSQLWIAEAPAWEPRLLVERPAAERALWLPSLRGAQIAFVEVIIGADSSLDERHVILTDLAAPDADPRRLDASGNATMPILTEKAVVWKEPDRGFAMFNWGRLYRFTFETWKVTTVNLGPQEYVNYPSGGGRFVAMWGADSSAFAVYDLERGMSRLIQSYDNQIDSVLRPALAGDLLVWLHSATDGLGNGPPAQLEYAWLPEPGSDRGE